MSTLGDFLERFYGTKPLFHTVHARVNYRKKSPPADSSSVREPVIGRRRRNAKTKESEENLVFWARLPDQARVETTRVKDGNSETSIEVVNGSTFWKRHGNGIVEQGSEERKYDRDQSLLPTEFQRHFDRRLLRQCFAALTLEANGMFQVAGRKCLRIRAVQVPGAQLWPHWLAWEASEFEFAADMERAVLLSIVGLVDGEAIETHEVIEVKFDEEIDDSLFTYQAGTGETVQPAVPITEHITLEAAAARAPFTVLKPTYVPESQRVQSDAMYHPKRPNSPEEYLSMFYRGGETFDHLWINQRRERDKEWYDELEWDELVIEGRRLEFSDPAPDEGLRILVCEQDSTDVNITSDLPRDEMVKIALSLTPVSR
jgi:hypothetical protein